ncbi:NUFIP1 domain-containing protein [Citrus sinensis]|uniref:NUFIP1 domain-containing protein n=1 Tax=Citrus sinensis TaxID=2711 RepID=A0ACB8L796_CITSI|nr:NUFIP1 domain-containing protein [Citrus sinensis]
MQPLFNAFANQTQSNSSTSTLPQMQAFRPNMLQNSVPMQPQTGIMNPQVPFPLSNSNMPATAPLMNQNNFMNASNPLLIAQSNHLGLPQLGHMFPVHGNFGNMPLNVSQGQIFGPNLSNLPQQFNQNMGFSNGQMCLQSVNQLLSMQMSNPCLFGNPQFGLVNQNQQNFVQPIKDVSGNNTLKSCSSEPRQGRNLQPSAFMRSQLPLVNLCLLLFLQRNFVQNGFRNLTFIKRIMGRENLGFIMIKNLKDQSDSGAIAIILQNFGDMLIFGNNNPSLTRPHGHGNGKAIKFGLANQMNQPQEKKRKSLALTYTEQEVKQWCEERRKNYPTKANINKKLTEKQSNSDVIDKEAKMRREQLKEILAKQAELGVEVAEIPSYYLLDSKKQVRARVENTMPLNKRGRFQNNYDKRGRYKRKDQFSKEQKLADKDSSNTSSFNKKKPTLLQKLLSADVKRDKSHLLQTFRFMAINSFFKDWPEKPVNFPLVMVKDGGAAGEVIEEKSLLLGEEDSEGKGRRMVEHFEHDENRERMHHNIQGFEDENDDEEEEDNDNGEQMKVYIAGKGNTNDEHVRLEEEEGEIID